MAKHGKSASSRKPAQDASTKQQEGRRKQLERRDTETRVQRDIENRFPELSHIDTDVRLLNNKTLRQTLLEDSRSAKKEGRELSGAYWCAMRHQWVGEASPAAKLVVKNKAEPVDPRLAEALMQAQSTNTNERNSNTLLAWLASSAAPNQRVVCAVYRQGLACNPDGNPAHMNMVLAIMRWTMRHNLIATYAAETAAMHPVFDKALLAQWNKMKGTISVDRFWDISKDVAALVLSVPMADKVFQAGKNYKSVKGELQDLGKSSELGKAMFEEPLAHLVLMSFADYTNEKIRAMLTDKSITQAKVDALLNECEGKVKEMGLSAQGKSEREIKVQYRGMCLTISVKTASQELRTRVSAALKEKAVMFGFLTPLWFEPSILGAPEHDPDLRMDADMVKNAKIARELANEEQEKTKPDTGDLAKAMMKSKRGVLAQADSYFSVEEALTGALTAGPGAEKLQELILKQLPDQDRKVTLAECSGKLDDMMSEPLFSFVGRAAQSTAKVVIDAVRCMAIGSAPQLSSWDLNPFLKLARVQLAYFYWLELPAEGGRPAQTLHGDKALLHKFEELQQKYQDKEEALTPMDFKDFRTFHWLLNADKLQRVEDILTELYKAENNCPVMPSLKASKRTRDMGKSTSGKKHKGKSTNNGAIPDSVAALFE